MNNRPLAIVLSSLIFVASLFGQPRLQKEGRIIADDPDGRAEFELMRLRDPKSGQIPSSIREKELTFARSIASKEALLLKGKGTTGVSTGQSLTWSQRGPYNVGGRTRALAVDITNESIMLAGGVSGGMWRSTNSGASWVKVTGISALQSVTCIVQDIRSGHGNTWYYGTGELIGNSAAGGGASFRGDGVFKSTDSGISWTQLASTVSGTPQSFDQGFDYVWNLAIDPSDLSHDILYAATISGIRKSTDGGTTWSYIQGAFGNSSPRYTDIAVTSTGIIYTGLSKFSVNGGTTTVPSPGIYRSSDQGATFTNINPSSGWPANYNRIVIGVAPSNQSIVYFLLESPGSGALGHNLWQYTYLSGDGAGAGGSWSNRTTNLPAFGGNVGNFDSQGSYDLVVRVKPDDPNTVFIGGTNLYRSTNGFSSTTATRWIGGYSPANNVSIYPNQHPDQHAITFSPTNPLIMFTGDDGGVQKTTNCLGNAAGNTPVTWISLNNGYFTGQFYTVALDHGTAGNDVVIGGLQDNGTWFTNTTNVSTPYVDVLGGDGAYCSISDGRGAYYLSAQNAQIYKNAVDNNGNVSAWTRIDPSGGSGYLFINPFVLDPNTSNIMYLAGGSTVWRNNDLAGIPLDFSNNPGTTNWDELSSISVNPAVVSALGLTRSPANRLYIGTSDGRVLRLDGANSGQPSPIDVTGANFPAGAYVSCIAVDPLNGNNVLTVFSNYSVISLYYSSDGGTSWASVSGNLEQNPDGSGNGPSVRWATIFPGGGYFVGTSTGLYSAPTLAGATTVWAQEGSSTIGNVVVDMIDARLSDGRMVIGTHGNGIYSTTLTVPPPPAPTLALPADSASDQPLSLTLSWDPSAGASTYHLQLSMSNAFTPLLMDDSTLSSTLQAVSGLSHSTAYYWRVSAKNIGGVSPYSAPRTFSTVLPPPPVPVPAFPVDHNVNEPLSLSVRWHPSPTASRYGVQIARDSLFTNLVLNDQAVIDTNRYAGPLISSTPYYWRVNAQNAGGTSSYSVRQTFTTIVGTPTLIYPSAGAVDLQPAFDMRWNRVSSAVGYHLQIATDTLFLALVVDDSSLVDTARSVSGLAVSTTYYWRAKARSVSGNGEYSAMSTFSTISSVPAIPLLLSPSNYSINQPLVCLLRWGTSARASGYQVQFSDDSTFGAFLVNDSLLVDTIKEVSGLTHNTVYFWRVRGGNAVGNGTFSAIRRFTTDNVGSALYLYEAGWNMVSVPLKISDYLKTNLFAAATSPAFSYEGGLGYVLKDTLQNTRGYWVKFDSIQTIIFTGEPFAAESAAVHTGWNMIGAFSSPLLSSAVSSVPAGIMLTDFFGFEGSYTVADTLQPSRGYWVKTSQPGLLLFGAPQILPSVQSMPMKKYNQIVIRDASKHTQALYLAWSSDEIQKSRYEFPPVFPEHPFAARFSSNYALETVDQGGNDQWLPITISGGNYPMTIEWDMTRQEMNAVLIFGEKRTEMQPIGKIQIHAATPKVGIMVSGKGRAPKEFALDQNYPNPFNPTTQIRYKTAEASWVKLSIYNVLGEIISAPVDRFQEAGIYTIDFDARGCASGVYFYELTATSSGNGKQGTFHDKKKMILLR